ncbi:MAG: right-handed parallel beta-helix repeat-containing protein, partial [Planctomycetota bacterium]
MPHESTRSHRFHGRSLRPVHLAARASATAALIGALTGVGSTQTVLHVDADLTTGANDGSSWADAYQGSAGLHAAFDAAAPGDEVWIAAGTYLPSTVGSVGAQFHLDTDDVTVRGGFEGTETSPLERRFDAGVETVLTGDLLGDDDGTPARFIDNSARVLSIDANGAILEDVRVTAGGNAPGGVSLQFGRTTFPYSVADKELRRCTVDGSVGSGALVGGGGFGASFRVVDCIFRGNGGVGLEVFTVDGSLVIDRCWTVDNGGDGLSVTTGDLGTPVSNVVSARNGGRGVLHRFVGSEGFAGMTYEHCTVAFNAGVAIEASGCCGTLITTVSDSIVRGNNGGLAQFSNGGTIAFAPSPLNSLVQGEPGADADPRFRDEAGGDFRLLSDSPA